MPFTLSHPAAVIPFLRRPFVPVALILGAVVPDLPYFLDTPVTAQSWYEPFVNATFSHSVQGLLIVGFPSVIVLALLFQLFRRPVAQLLPVHLRLKRFDKARPRRFYSYIMWFLISALVGMTTHYVWDSLTETALRHTRVLQHGSTFLGICVIVFWVMWSVRSKDLVFERVPASQTWARQRLVIVMAILLASTTIAALSVLQLHKREGTLGLELTLTTLMKVGIRNVALAVIVYALMWYSVTLFKQAKRS